MDERAAVLRSVPWLSGLAADALAVLASHARWRTFRRNEVIMHRDDPAGALHVIRSGNVKVTLPTEQGDELVAALLGPGELFGEIAVLDGEPRSATVTAVEPTETLALPREALTLTIREQPEIALAIITNLLARWRREQELAEDTLSLDLDARLTRRLLMLCEQRGHEAPDVIEVPFPYTQSDLAGWLGATRVSINRLLGAYQDDGLIRLGKGSFAVLRLEALRERARR